MKLHRILIQNYMSFGNHPTVVDFDALRNSSGGLVRITGDIIRNKNSDAAAAIVPSDLPDDNGAGKSSFISAIYYAIYGEVFRRKRKKKVSGLVHNDAGPMLVELEVDDVLVRRGREPNCFEVYRDPSGNRNFTEEKRVDMAKGLQEWLEAYLGFDKQLFCSTVVFDQRNCDPFLESEAKDRRVIVEKLLGMDEWQGYLERARAMMREEKKKHEELAALSGKERALAVDIAAKVADLESQAKSRTEELARKIAAVEEGIANLDAVKPEAVIAGHDLCDAYAHDMQVYRAMTAAVATANKTVDNCMASLVALKATYDTAVERESAAQKRLACLSAEQPPSSVKCGNCGANVESLHEKWLANVREQLASTNDAILRETTSISSAKEELRRTMANLENATKLQAEARASLGATQDPGEEPRRPRISRQQAGELQDQLARAGEQLKLFRQQLADDPFASTIARYKAESEAHVKNSAEAAKMADCAAAHVAQLKEWEEAFGDNGIKTYCISSLVGELNNQVNFWLQHLFFGRMAVFFDENMEVTVTIDGRDRDIGLISNGEATRVDVAVYFAFADIMRMTNKTDCNVVFLDEIGGNALDLSGKTGLYQALKEMAEDRLVAVITHDHALGEMMSDCPEIVVKNIDGEAVAEVLGGPIYSATAGS